MAELSIAPVQSLMARAALGWSVQDAGRNAGVGANTVSRFENGTEAREATRRALRSAYEYAGVEFIPENGGGPGIRLLPTQDGWTIDLKRLCIWDAGTRVGLYRTDSATGYVLSGNIVPLSCDDPRSNAEVAASAERALSAYLLRKDRLAP